MSFKYSTISVALRRYILLPFYWKWIKHSRVLDYYHILQEQQWNSLEKNREIQAHRLYRLLEYASENIPYYKRIVKNQSIKVSEDTIFDDIKKFPFLTKKIIREHFNELYRFRDNTYYLNHSGGSTGEPVEFYQDKTYADWSQATTLLFNDWAGCPIGSRIAKLWGSERDVFKGTHGLKGSLSGFLYNQRLVNAFNMSRQQIEDFINMINRWKPTMILAYVEPIYEVAKIAVRKNWSVYSPTSIMTSAGTLFEAFRNQIENAFNSPVFNRYGTREVGDVACECSKHNGLYISIPTHFVEIARSNGETCAGGETGEIAVTSLTNYTMPLIRYKIGDRGSLKEKACPSSRGLPLLKSIEGRVTSIFRNRRGDIISPEYFIHLIGVVLNKRIIIKKFQVIQEQKDFIIVKLILNSQNKKIVKALISEIEEKIKLVMGVETTVEFEFVDAIPLSPSGKYLYTISKVHHEED